MVNYFRRVSTFFKRLVLNYPLPQARQCNKSIIDRHPTAFRRGIFVFITGGIITFVCVYILNLGSMKSSNFETIKMNIDELTEVTAKTKRKNLAHRISQMQLEKYVDLTSRERQFIKYASVEYDGQVYMTPRDFLDSLSTTEPRPRLQRHNLTKQKVEKMRYGTPSRRKGSPHLFRQIRDDGIISYTEFLFLLSILTETPSAFHTAFKMFDADYNDTVDLNEFLIIHKILGGSLKEHEVDENTKRILLRLVSTEEQAKSLKVRNPESKTWKEFLSPSPKHYRVRIKKKDLPSTTEPEPIQSASEHANKNSTDESDDEENTEKPMVMTMVLSHLFGARGDNILEFDGMVKFIDNMQREVLEVEFNEYSKGHNSISEIDFTRILLRYTYMDVEKYDLYFERILSRMEDGEGIPFEDFFLFCQFLNHLEDFAVAIRMYEMAMSAISQDNFLRAVKICTGFTLSHHLVDTLFALFDEDGDGLLSYEEFIHIMKDRLFRGFKSTESYVGWNAFKSCVNKALKYT